MNERIESLYYNLENLTGHYVEFPETEDSYKILNDYIEKQFSFTNTDKNAEVVTQLYDLIFEYAINCEKQGFISGFKYAVSLLMETLNNTNE